MAMQELDHPTTNLISPNSFPHLPIPLKVGRKLMCEEIEEGLSLANLDNTVLEQANTTPEELGRLLQILYEVNPLMHPVSLSNVLPGFQRFQNVSGTNLFTHPEAIHPSAQDKIAIGLTGPSASGKDTIYKHLLRHSPVSITKTKNATTRIPRPGEREEGKYYFVSKDEFEAMIQDGHILEYTVQHGEYYGTPAIGAELALNQARIVFSFAEITNAQNVLDFVTSRDLNVLSTTIFTLPLLDWRSYSLEWLPSQRGHQILPRAVRAALEIKVASQIADIILLNPYDPIEPGMAASQVLADFLHLPTN